MISQFKGPSNFYYHANHSTESDLSNALCSECQAQTQRYLSDSHMFSICRLVLSRFNGGIGATAINLMADVDLSLMHA